MSHPIVDAFLLDRLSSALVSNEGVLLQAALDEVRSRGGQVVVAGEGIVSEARLTAAFGVLCNYYSGTNGGESLEAAARLMCRKARDRKPDSSPSLAWRGQSDGEEQAEEEEEEEEEERTAPMTLSSGLSHEASQPLSSFARPDSVSSPAPAPAPAPQPQPQPPSSFSSSMPPPSLEYSICACSACFRQGKSRASPRATKAATTPTCVTDVLQAAALTRAFLTTIAPSLPREALLVLGVSVGRGLKGGVVAGPEATKVIQEIRDTEDNFVQGLRILRDQFMAPLVDKPKRAGLVAKEVEILFPSDIDIFQQLHTTKVLPLLDSCAASCEVDEVAEAFQQIVPLVAFYQHYFDAYPEAMDLLREKLKTTKKLADFIEEVEAKLKAEKKPGQSSIYLTHLLANPFQRPIRYNLLLKELCKRHCGKDNIGDEQHIASCPICQSSKKMEQMTTALNEKRRANEDKKECVAIINMFRPENRPALMAGLPHRQYVHEGEIEAIGNTVGPDGKDLYVYVFTDSLVVSTRPKQERRRGLFGVGEARPTYMNLVSLFDMTTVVATAAETNDTDLVLTNNGATYMFRVKVDDRAHLLQMISLQHQRAYEVNLRGNTDNNNSSGGGEASTAAGSSGGPGTENEGPARPSRANLGRTAEANQTTMVAKSLQLSFFRDPLFEELVEGLETGAIVSADQPAVLGRQGDIKIMDRTVSRHQCQISYDVNRACFTIRDLGSVGGTFMNAKRVLAFPGHTLEDGDVFFAGKCKFMIFRDFDDPDKMHLHFRSGLASSPTGDDEFQSFLLDPNRQTVVGRAAAADPGTHNVIKISIGPDSGLSRTHFRIVPTGDGQYQLLDERSRFGTFANPKAINTEVGFPLNTGDVIQLCEAVWVQVKVRYEESTSAHNNLASQKFDYASLLNDWLQGQQGAGAGPVRPSALAAAGLTTPAAAAMGGGSHPMMSGGGGGSGGPSASVVQAFRTKVLDYNNKLARRDALLQELSALEPQLETLYADIGMAHRSLALQVSAGELNTTYRLPEPPKGSSLAEDATVGPRGATQPPSVRPRPAGPKPPVAAPAPPITSRPGGPAWAAGGGGGGGGGGGATSPDQFATVAPGGWMVGGAGSSMASGSGSSYDDTLPRNSMGGGGTGGSGGTIGPGGKRMVVPPPLSDDTLPSGGAGTLEARPPPRRPGGLPSTSAGGGGEDMERTRAVAGSRNAGALDATAGGPNKPTPPPRPTAAPSSSLSDMETMKASPR